MYFRSDKLRLHSLSKTYQVRLSKMVLCIWRSLLIVIVLQITNHRSETFNLIGTDLIEFVYALASSHTITAHLKKLSHLLGRISVCKKVAKRDDKYSRRQPAKWSFCFLPIFFCRRRTFDRAIHFLRTYQRELKKVKREEYREEKKGALKRLPNSKTKKRVTFVKGSFLKL